MKTVWRNQEFISREGVEGSEGKTLSEPSQPSPPSRDLNPIWTMTAPGNDEKKFGKHPTEKPVALIERCLLASTDRAIACSTRFWAAARRRWRPCAPGHFFGIELDAAHFNLAAKRSDREIILRTVRVRVEISVARVASSLWLEPVRLESESAHSTDATPQMILIFPVG